jgi:hypothetical protein
MRREEYSHDDWEVLSAVPRLVFFYVASADGNISEDELLRFQERWKGDILHKKFSRDEQIDLFIKAVWEQSSREVPLKITESQVRSAVTKFSKIIKGKPGERALRTAIIDLAQNTAEATAAFFVHRVTKEEQDAVDNVIAWL